MFYFVSFFVLSTGGLFVVVFEATYLLICFSALQLPWRRISCSAGLSVQWRHRRDSADHCCCCCRQWRLLEHLPIHSAAAAAAVDSDGAERIRLDQRQRSSSRSKRWTDRTQRTKDWSGDIFYESQPRYESVQMLKILKAVFGSFKGKHPLLYMKSTQQVRCHDRWRIQEGSGGHPRL